MRKAMIGISLVFAVMQARASTFVINWDLNGNSAGATDLAMQIYFAEAGGSAGVKRASVECYSSVDGYEFSPGSSFCMAFDEAVYLLESRDGAVVIPDKDYFSEASIEARRSLFMREWTANGQTQMRSQIQTAVKIRFDTIIRQAVEANQNGAS